MTCMSRNLKMAISRNLSSLAHLIQCPKASLIINEKTAAAKSCSTLYILNCTNDLFLSTQTITHSHPFFCMYRCRSISCGTWTNCKNQVCLPLMCKFNHFADFLISQTHNSLSLRNSVKVQTIAVHCFQQCFHNLRTLNSGHLKTILSSIFETLFRSGHIIGISTRHTN